MYVRNAGDGYARWPTPRRSSSALRGGRRAPSVGSVRWRWRNDMRDGAICLATLLDSSRLQVLVRQANAWPGAIAAAILASPPSANLSLSQQHAGAAAALEAIRNHEHRVRLVLVDNPGYDCPPRFPFNLLRNVALSFCVEPFVLLLDVDFVPLPLASAYYTLRTLTSSALMRAPGNALVVPAFDYSEQQSDGQVLDVANRTMMRELIQTGSVVPFGSAGGLRELWLPGHSCTQSSRWLESSTPFQIEHCHPQYEPYLLLPRQAAPPFDESFSGRGFDKASYTYELFARGTSLWTAPDVFVVHQQEARSHAVSACESVGIAVTLSPDEAARRRNPGETCVRAFLERMRDAYRYAPRAPAHAAYRSTVQSQRWGCNAAHERPLPRPRMMRVVAGRSARRQRDRERTAEGSD